MINPGIRAQDPGVNSDSSAGDQSLERAKEQRVNDVMSKIPADLLKNPEFVREFINSLDDEAKKSLKENTLDITSEQNKNRQLSDYNRQKKPDQFFEDAKEALLLKTVKSELSNLSNEDLEKIQQLLFEISSDEAKDESREKNYQIRKHSHEEYDHFRIQEITQRIAKAKTESLEKAKLEALEKAKREALERAKREALAKAKLEALEKANKLKAVELKNLLKESEEGKKEIIEKKTELEEKDREAEEILRKIEELKKEIKPLVAINADFTEDKKDLAHDYAERELTYDIENENGFKRIIKRIWEGKFFKKYYLQKYEREIMNGDRTIRSEDPNVEDIDDIIENRSKAAIRRATLGATDDYSNFIHEEAGEKLTEADERTTKIVREAIERFATSVSPEDGDEEELRSQFGEALKRLQAENEEKGIPVNEKLINNYYEVALQARNCVRHNLAIEDVMEGFKVYNAKVRDGIRTEAHRDNIDKLVNKIESSKLGRFIPADVLATAASTAYSLSSVGFRALFGAAGGILTSGVIAGLRERNRITEDRARMLRDLAMGYEYGGQSTEETEPEDKKAGFWKKRAAKMAKKQAEYEAKIAGTQYNVCPAKTLIANLEAAIESKDPNKVLSAIAEARARIDYSDSEKRRDLIIYSSADKVGEERLMLDIAIYQAKHALSKEDQEKIDLQKKELEKEIQKNVAEKDESFKKFRATQAMKQARKTVALGAVFFAFSQEASALLNPRQIGILEKYNIVKTNNDTDAEETLLASGFGLNRGRQIPKAEGKIITVEEKRIVDSVDVDANDQAYIEELEKQGYKRTGRIRDSFQQESGSRIKSYKPNESPSRIKNYVYDGWANNDTKLSDGNELRLYLGEDGRFVSGMHGNSTMGGNVLNYNQLAAEGKIKGILTIGDSKFMIEPSVNSAGQLTFGDGNGIFTTSLGETINAVGPNGEKTYKFMEVIIDNGIDANGAQHIIPMATSVGNDTFDGVMQSVVKSYTTIPPLDNYVLESVIKLPKLDITRNATETLRDISMSGVVVPDLTPRTGLGIARQPGAPEVPAEDDEEIIDVVETPPIAPEPPAPEPEQSASSDPDLAK